MCVATTPVSLYIRTCVHGACTMCARCVVADCTYIQGSPVGETSTTTVFTIHRVIKDLPGQNVPPILLACYDACAQEQVNNKNAHTFIARVQACRYLVVPR